MSKPPCGPGPASPPCPEAPCPSPFDAQDTAQPREHTTCQTFITPPRGGRLQDAPTVRCPSADQSPPPSVLTVLQRHERVAASPSPPPSPGRTHSVTLRSGTPRPPFHLHGPLCPSLPRDCVAPAIYYHPSIRPPTSPFLCTFSLLFCPTRPGLPCKVTWGSLSSMHPD